MDDDDLTMDHEALAGDFIVDPWDDEAAEDWPLAPEVDI